MAVLLNYRPSTVHVGVKSGLPEAKRRVQPNVSVHFLFLSDEHAGVRPLSLALFDRWTGNPAPSVLKL